MRIQITTNEICVEFGKKDLLRISEKYKIKKRIKFSFLDDETLDVIIRMDNSERVSIMYEEHELIIFLPFFEFERWLNSDASTIRYGKENNPSNNVDIIFKKEVSVPKIKTFGTPGQYKVSNLLSEMKINYN